MDRRRKDSVEIQAISVDEAVRLALEQLGRTRDEVDIEILAEPSATGDLEAEEALVRVTVRGYRMLLAHPERNHSFQNDPERLARLVEQGILVQITASALASPERGGGGRRGAGGPAGAGPAPGSAR